MNLTNLYLNVEFERRVNRPKEHRRTSKNSAYQVRPRETTTFARWLSYYKNFMKTKVQHRKQQRSWKKMSVLQSEDTIEISSSSFGLSQSKFIISNFFVDEECAKKGRNSNTIRTAFINSVFLTDFILISWIAWVKSLCMTRV